MAILGRTGPEIASPSDFGGAGGTTRPSPETRGRVWDGHTSLQHGDREMDWRNAAGSLGIGGGRALIPSNRAHPLSDEEGAARISGRRRPEGREEALPEVGAPEAATPEKAAPVEASPVAAAPEEAAPEEAVPEASSKGAAEAVGSADSPGAAAGDDVLAEGMRRRRMKRSGRRPTRRLGRKVPSASHSKWNQRKPAERERGGGDHRRGPSPFAVRLGTPPVN